MLRGAKDNPGENIDPTLRGRNLLVAGGEKENPAHYISGRDQILFMQVHGAERTRLPVQPSLSPDKIFLCIINRVYRSPPAAVKRSRRGELFLGQ